MAHRAQARYGSIKMGSNNGCPKADEVSRLIERVETLQRNIEEVKEIIKMNAEYRIYNKGLTDGKKEGISKIIRIIDLSSRIVGSVVILSLLMIAGNTVGAFEFIMKLVGVK